MAGVAARLRASVPEREIFVRTDGAVHVLRITTRMQLSVLSLAVIAVGACMMLIGGMLIAQRSVDAQRAVMATRQSAIHGEAVRVKAERRSAEMMTRDLERRQNALEALIESRFGADVERARVIGRGEEGHLPPARTAPQSVPRRLSALRERQQHLADRLRAAAHVRLTEVESAIRQVGLNPAQLARNGRGSAMGGPFIPVRASKNPHAETIRSDTDLHSLALLLDRLAAMEAAFDILPSARPTTAPMMTSSYGYRRDPFNGLAAFHAGIDFPGAFGQPILAAADGKIVFVGQRSGYGNCIELDHGHGITTRYAHLSGFVARRGQRVERGQQIARMGSTGRSTGTHLHFEVRVNGSAVDPRPFLDSRNHVLEARQDARLTSAGTGRRG